ncbi:hypothetical protein MASR1M8_06200 [Thermomonas brevis]
MQARNDTAGGGHRNPETKRALVAFAGVAITHHRRGVTPFLPAPAKTKAHRNKPADVPVRLPLTGRNRSRHRR